uniref:Uncharacterized protein n=1 Tax=Panagrolaimus sp. ES5 TaxID=591445 RepID=A0AC34F775_9BILA
MDCLNSTDSNVSVEDQKKALKSLEENAAKLMRPEEKHIALNLGVIPLLVEFLDCPNPGIRKDTLSALLQYVSDPEFTEAAIAAGAISKLLNIGNLPGSTVEIAFSSICVLKCIIQKSVKGRDLLIEAGKTPLFSNMIGIVDYKTDETGADIYTQQFENIVKAFDEFNINSESNYHFTPEQLKNAFKSMSNMEKAMLDFSKIATQNPEESQAWQALTNFTQQGIATLYSLIDFLHLSNPTPAEIKGIVEIIPKIITVSEHPDDKIKCIIARVLAYLSNTEHQICIVQANGVPYLLKMFNSDDIVLRYLSAHTFQNFKMHKTAEFQAQINEAKKVSPLLKLLESSKIELVLNVIEALEITARENKSNVFKSKIIFALMNLLKSKNNLIRFSAATAVVSITREYESRPIILGAAIPILIEEIQCQQFNFKSLLTIFDCFKKGKNDEIQVIIDAKGIPALMKLLKSENEHICILSATLIAIFMFEKMDHGEVQPSQKRIEIVVQAGVVPTFVEFLKSSNITLQMMASEGLVAITYRGVENIEAVLHANAIPSILKLLQHENPEIRLNAIKAITKLCLIMTDSEECKIVLKSLGEIGEKMVELEMPVAVVAGIFPALMKHMDSINHDICLEALYTLLQFVKVPELSKIAVEAGVIPPLIEIAKISDTLSNKSIAAVTLITLKFLVQNTPNGKELAIVAGAPSVIIDAIEYIPAMIDRKAIHIFTIVKSLMESSTEAAFGTSASEHLKYLHENLSDKEFKDIEKQIAEKSGTMTAFKIINDLTEDPNPCAYKIENVVKAEVVPHCVKLLQHEYTAIKTIAIQALSIINNGEEEHRQAIILADGVPSLIEILKSDDIVFRYLAAHLLSNLTNYGTSELKAQINEMKNFLPLLKLLESPNTDFLLSIRIVKALGITVHNEKQYRIDDEPIKTLMKVLNSENDIVRLNAAKTLFKFTLERSLNFVQERLQLSSKKRDSSEITPSKNIIPIMKAIIPVLTEYVQSENVELYKDAYKIFCILIEKNDDEIKSLIIDANGVAAVFKALNSNKSQLYVSGSIEKLCYKKFWEPNLKAIDAFVDSGAIQIYMKHLDSDDPNLCQIGFSGLNRIAEVLQKSLPEQKQLVINSGAAELLTEYRRIEKIEMDAIAETVSEDEEEEEELE